MWFIIIHPNKHRKKLTTQQEFFPPVTFFPDASIELGLGIRSRMALLQLWRLDRLWVNSECLTGFFQLCNLRWIKQMQLTESFAFQTMPSKGDKSVTVTSGCVICSTLCQQKTRNHRLLKTTVPSSWVQNLPISGNGSWIYTKELSCTFKRSNSELEPSSHFCAQNVGTPGILMATHLQDLKWW